MVAAWLVGPDGRKRRGRRTWSDAPLRYALLRDARAGGFLSP